VAVPIEKPDEVESPFELDGQVPAVKLNVCSISLTRSQDIWSLNQPDPNYLLAFAAL